VLFTLATRIQEEFMHSRHIYAATLVLLSLSACANGTTTPTNDDYDAVASGLGAMQTNETGGDVASMSDAIVLARGELPLGLSIMASGAVRGVRGGLMYDYTLACSDIDGVAMASCNATTDSARVTVNWSGDLTLPWFQGSIDRSGDFRVTGLQSDIARIDGTSDFGVDADWQRGTSRDAFMLDYQATYEAILIADGERMPVGGSAHWIVNAQRTRSRADHTVTASFTMDAVLSFDANGALLTLDGTHRYRIDGSGQAHRI
jgi:hypothetical protein